MSLHCQGYAHLLLLNCIILEVSNEVWSLRESLGLVCHDWTLFSDRWVWLPVWLCAAVRQPQLCLSVGPSGERAHPGSGAAHMAGHTPGSCQQPEPAIRCTMRCVCVCLCVSMCLCLCVCVCHHLYTLLWGKLTFQLFHCWVKHADSARWMEKQ